MARTIMTAAARGTAACATFLATAALVLFEEPIRRVTSATETQYTIVVIAAIIIGFVAMTAMISKVARD